MYNRRTKINPLWNTIIIGGFSEDKPYVLFCEYTCTHTVHVIIII